MPIYTYKTGHPTNNNSPRDIYKNNCASMYKPSLNLCDYMYVYRHQNTMITI